MIKYKNFLENNLLNESLDSSVDYHLTQDTSSDLRRIYAAFEIDGTQYGMSLEESNKDRIYIVKCYRIVNSKARHWSFRKSAHVRIGLSTLLQFVNDAVPRIKERADGFITRIPKKRKSETIVNFASRVIRRSHINDFRTVPIRKSEEAKYNYLFFVRRQKNPEMIFKSKSFKGYDFDPQDQVLPDIVADEIVPKRREKKILALKPSQSSFVKQYVSKIELDIESDIIDQIEELQEDEDEENTKHDLRGYQIDRDGNLNGDTLEKAYKKIIQTLNDFYYDKPLNRTFIIYATILKLHHKDGPGYKNLINDRFKELWPDANMSEKREIINDFVEMVDEFITAKKEDHFVYFMNFLVNTKILKVPHMIKLEKSLGIASLNRIFGNPSEQEIFNDIQNLSVSFEELLQLLKKYEDDLTHNFGTFEDIAEVIYNKYGEDLVLWDGKPRKIHKSFKTNIDPNQLEAEIEGTGNFNYSELNAKQYDHHDFSYHIKEKDENWPDKEECLHSQYGRFISDLNHQSRTLIRSYTDDGYKLMNAHLRNLPKGLDEDFEFFMKNEVSKERFKYSIMGMYEAFKEMPPLETPMWVYRDCNVPTQIYNGLFEGKDYIDPAFLSTTFKSSLYFQPAAKIRFRIFLPKRARVLPPLNASSYDNEKEVILPPFSVLRTIRLDEVLINDFGGEENKALVTSIFAGSAFDSFVEYLKQVNYLEESTLKYNLSENKKKDDDRTDKFSDGIDEDMQKVIDKLKKQGKLQENKTK